jgi:hypothetical protein
MSLRRGNHLGHRLGRPIPRGRYRIVRSRAFGVGDVAAQRRLRGDDCHRRPFGHAWRQRYCQLQVTGQQLRRHHDPRSNRRDPGGGNKQAPYSSCGSSDKAERRQLGEEASSEFEASQRRAAAHDRVVGQANDPSSSRVLAAHGRRPKTAGRGPGGPPIPQSNFPRVWPLRRFQRREQVVAGMPAKSCRRSL